ncbi:MAG: homocysteine S-methyltransferase family protein [Leptospiraceae bacterium]|nr:homocysteine S-methyltransferase family protein [Leptospiraceae bacterium]
MRIVPARKLQLTNQPVLMEGAVVERIRRAAGPQLHTALMNAPLIYDPAGRAALERIYQEYIDIALAAGLNLWLCTPTWRANRERLQGSAFPDSINQDAARFMCSLRDKQGQAAEQISIGGLIGCRHDCYQPSEGLDSTSAFDFHSWQIANLAEGGVDFLIAQTLPALPEALGIARSMARTQLPYIISFVINRQGLLLDGSRLSAAVRQIDEQVDRPPLGYAVNCAWPGFLSAEDMDPELRQRLIGFMANASDLDHCELDGCSELQTQDAAVWADLMLQLYRQQGLRVLGGCCGTDGSHLSRLAALLSPGAVAEA